MGIEQDTAVSGSNQDIITTKDLTDLRLLRASKTWLDFKCYYQNQIEQIGNQSSADITLLANTLSASIIRSIGFESPHRTIDIVSEKRINQLLETVSSEGNKVIFMRHGEQSPPQCLQDIKDPGQRKIMMMQNPCNKEDLLTNEGFAEAFTTAFILLYAKAKTGKTINILTSENNRALEVAKIFSLVTESGYKINQDLNSITYKDEVDDPSFTVGAFLKDLPDGNMPWEEEKVRKWCKETKKGKSEWEAITQVVERLCWEGMSSSENNINVIITHSQQLTEVLRVFGRLTDNTIRLPELTMIALTSPKQLFILPKGVLIESKGQNKAKQMRKILEEQGEGYNWYKSRNEQYQTNLKIPFLVSPEPFCLSPEQAAELTRIGADVASYMHSVDELYFAEEEVKNLLDQGKPNFLKERRDMKYLFVRPDLLLTPDGFSICEIETSPFGFALAELINRSYREAGFKTLVDDNYLSTFIKNNTPTNGSILYSFNGISYEGQLQFLADKVFSGKDRSWTAKETDFVEFTPDRAYYRAFYLYECVENLFVNNLVNRTLEEGNLVIPSYTPYLEEKAILSLIWDKRWAEILKIRLGLSAFDHLRKIIPLTWVVGQEKFVNDALSIDGLNSLSKSKRNFVLKKSGFENGSSWAKGVSFLQEKSSDVAAKLLNKAQESDSLYIVQEFKKSQERNLVGVGEEDICEMKARIRLTPYFSLAEGTEGNLIAVKATGCEKTNYIHGSTASINTAVAVA